MLSELLQKLDIHLVLVDVGASGDSPAIWRDIRRNAIYVGFDPDQREMRTDQDDGAFFRSHIVNAAVTTSETAQEVVFYLTQSPYCSSTLLPDSNSLQHYLFAPLFEVVDRQRVQSVTLDQVMNQLKLPAIDWLKTDTQGTDLRIFQSLSSAFQSQLVALDIEPGLIDAYEGEDLFVDSHKILTQNGFWLSNLDLKTTIRMRPETIANHSRENAARLKRQFEQQLKPSPAWVEARYLRTLEFAGDQAWSQRQYVKLWACAMLDSQFGFALDTAAAVRERFGDSDVANELDQIAWSRAMQGRHRRLLIRRLKTLVKKLARFG